MITAPPTKPPKIPFPNDDEVVTENSIIVIFNEFTGLFYEKFTIPMLKISTKIDRTVSK